MSIYEQIHQIMNEKGIESLIKEGIEAQARKEREIWLNDLIEMRKMLKPNDEKELKFLNREIALLRRKLGIAQTIDEIRQQWKIRNKRYYERKKSKRLPNV